MRPICASCACILLTVAAFPDLSAAAFPDAIRRDHPRMFFNADTWPAVVARSKGPACTNRWHLIARARSYPDEPVCSGMEKVSFGTVKTATGTHRVTAATPIDDIREFGPAAAECALAWRFTRDRKLLEKARKMLVASAAAYRQAYANGRDVAWTSTSRILALCAYDWIFEGLSPDQRREIIVPLVEHVEETDNPKGPIIRRNTGGVHTGFYGVPSLLWYSGLAAYGDGFCDALAARHLRKGHDLCRQMLAFRAKGAGDDGALNSGVPLYSTGAYPWAHFNFFHTYRSAFGENLAARYPAMALFPNWIWWMWIQRNADGSHPLYNGFGDDTHVSNAFSMWFNYQHMTQYMNFFREVDPAAARLAASLRAFSPAGSSLEHGGWCMLPYLLDADCGVKPHSRAELASCPVKARHFESLGQVLMRSGWETNSTYASFTAGATLQQHKHYDENNFTIYRRDFLAIDSGSRASERDFNLKYYYAQTVAHNCLLIRRKGEPLTNYWGPTYKGPEGAWNDGGQNGESARVLAFETNPRYTYVAADAARCYGEKCSAAVRQFVHILPDTFVVYDRVEVERPSDAKAWLLHFVNEPEVSGRMARADCGGGRLFCETLLPENPVIGKIGGPGREFWSNGKNWELEEAFVEAARRKAKANGHGPYFGSWRLEVSPAVPAKADRFLHVLTATDAGNGAAVRTERLTEAARDGVRLILPDGQTEATVLFNRVGPVGGRIRVGGDERPLTQAVAPQSGIVMSHAARPEKPADPERIARIAACLNAELKPYTPKTGREPTAADNRKTVESAERLLPEAPEPFPRELYLEFSRNGNRSRFEAWRKAWLGQLGVLCGAERIEGKGRFVAAIAARLDAVSAWPSWTLPAHDAKLTNFNGTHFYVDLFSAELARCLAEDLATLGPKLPPESVRRVRAAMERRVFAPYLAAAAKTDFAARDWHGGNWWFFGDNNWNPVCHSCCVRAALAGLADATVRAKFVEGAERALDAYFNGIAADGYCTEGMSYWNYGYGHFLMMGLAVREATGGKVDFFTHPRAKVTMRYPFAYQLQSGLSPHFADGGGNAKSHILRLGCRVWPELNAERRGALPIRSAFPEGQVWISRLAAGAKRPFAIAIKGGHNAEAHNHNDIGSWTIMLGGVTMAGDPGGEVYTRRTFSSRRYESGVLNSFGHPVPRVGGRLQSAGREFKARVLSTAFTDERDTVVLDLTGAYAVPSLESLVRTMTFDRAETTVTIADRVKFSSPTAFDDPIVTYGDFLADGAGDRFSLESGEGRRERLEGGVRVEGGTWSWRRELIENPQLPSPKRIAVAFDEPVASASVEWVFRVAGANGKD